MKAETSTATVTDDGELAEQPADDAAHEQQRDEHRDQREGDRDDREADLAGALQRRLERPLALLEVAHDVLDHHDRVVDDEADRDRQPHQREVVEAVAQPRTSRRRCRAATAAPRCSGSPSPTSVRRKMKITRTTRPIGQHQRELHVVHRRRGSTSERSDTRSTWTDGGIDASRCGISALMRVDDLERVGAGLALDHQHLGPLAVEPGAGARRFWCQSITSADVLEPHRRAVAIGDDDVAEARGVEKLIVGVERDGWCAPSRLPLGWLTVAAASAVRTSSRPMPRAASAAGLTWTCTA